LEVPIVIVDELPPPSVIVDHPAKRIQKKRSLKKLSIWWRGIRASRCDDRPSICTLDLYAFAYFRPSAFPHRYSAYGHSRYVAQPSMHMSDRSAALTLLPNHSCALS
jgi:hypothetical protein